MSVSLKIQIYNFYSRHFQVMSDKSSNYHELLMNMQQLYLEIIYIFQSFLSWILNPGAVIQVFLLISSSIALLLQIVAWLYWVCCSNGCMRAVGCTIFVCLQSLGHLRNVVSLILVYRCYFENCSSHMAQLVPCEFDSLL